MVHRHRGGGHGRYPARHTVTEAQGWFLVVEVGVIALHALLNIVRGIR